MLQSLLVGLDGSDHSKAALEWGLRWAKEKKALLVGLGVVDEEALAGPEFVPLGADAFKEQMDEGKIHQARRHVELALEHFAFQCAQRDVPCKVLEETGKAADQIVRQAQRYDVILLGQKTFFEFGPALRPDDTLTNVLKRSPRPVVVAPLQFDTGRSILVAYDGSLQAARTLQLFSLCLGDPACPVHVISVDEDHAEASRQAERAVEFLRFHHLDAYPHPVASKANPGGIVLERAKALEADLLVMGAYGRPSWREFFLGSVTQTILHESPVPLFLYH